MSAQRRAGSKRRGSASQRRSAGNGRNGAQVPEAVPPAGAATATAPSPATEEKPSRLTMPRRSSRPPMPEQVRPSRPPIPEQPKVAPESQNAFVRRFERLRSWYFDTTAEMKKIVWPDRETTKNLTLVVIGISIVLGILLGSIDFLLQAVFEALP